MAQAQQQAKVASSKVVQYVGTADVREIDAAAWDTVGVKDQKKVVWDRKNNWTVPVDQLSDDAVAYCDDKDSGFVVKDAQVE